MKRVIYLHPGELLDVRFVHPDLPRNALEWRSQGRPSHMLLQLSPGRIGYADPAISFERDFREER